VPFENDSNPSNDGEFEVIAIGYSEIRGALLLRYSDGRWSVEPDQQLVNPADGSAESLRGLLTTAVEHNSSAPPLAFAAPDDGWIVGTDATGSSPELLHLDAQGWVDCGPIGGPRPQHCGDPAGRTILQGGGYGRANIADQLTGLVSAASRVYLYGYRV